MRMGLNYCSGGQYEWAGAQVPYLHENFTKLYPSDMRPLTYLLLLLCLLLLAGCRAGGCGCPMY
jgi:hypothetical protein